MPGPAVCIAARSAKRKQIRDLKQKLLLFRAELGRQALRDQNDVEPEFPPLCDHFPKSAVSAQAHILKLITVDKERPLYLRRGYSLPDIEEQQLSDGGLGRRIAGVFCQVNDMDLWLSVRRLPIHKGVVKKQTWQPGRNLLRTFGG